jgi:ectoine hydroxylase-related dioxygenase (phytanoyl-CoA dioxygenase family)
MKEAAVLNEIEDVLEQCGVTEMTLAPEEKDALDRQGYFVAPGAISADWLARLRVAFEMAVGQPTTNGKQSGTRHVNDLAWKDAAFDGVYTHPKVLAAVYHALRRPFKLFQLGGRDPLPGYGQQGLHTDWYLRTPSEPFYVVTAIWLLDDFTEKNGATRLIPGSHLMAVPLPKSIQQPESRHPDQRLVIANAGSVLVFNGHLWHSGTRNETNRQRRVLQCQFVARELVRPADARPDIPERLAPAARYILGVHSLDKPSGLH